MRGFGYVARIVEVTDTYEILFGNAESKGPLESTRSVRKDTAKTDMKKQNTKLWNG